MEGQIRSGRLPVGVRLAYGAGEIGKNFIIFINNMFMLYFYTDVIRLDPGAAAGIIFTARIWDFLNDPLMGILCDKTKAREGKVRFWLKYCSVPGGILLFLSYFVPAFAEKWKVAWVFAMYLLQATVSTMLNVPMNSLAVRLTDSARERVVLGQFKNIMTILPDLVVNSLTLPLVALFGRGDERRGFALCMALYGAAYGASFLLCFLGTRGYDLSYQQERSLAKDGERVSQDLGFGDMLRGVWGNRYCLTVMAANILYLIFASIQGSSTVHYLKYNLGNTDLLALKSMAGVVVGIGATVALVPWVKRLGNARAATAGCAVIVAAEIARVILKDSTAWYYLLGTAAEGMGLSVFSLMITQCMYDSVEYGRYRNGVNLQAVVMALASFGQQVGSAVGAAIAGLLLDSVGYVSGSEPITKRSADLFFAENVVAPMVIFFVIGLIFLVVDRMEVRLRKMKGEGGYGVGIES